MSDEPYTVTRPQYVRLGAVLIALETSKSLKEAIRAVHDLKVETFAAAISAERSAGLSDGGKDRKATPKLSAKPAPACARCGGSGEIVAHASAVRNPGGGIERIVRRFEPCPECRGTP